MTQEPPGESARDEDCSRVCERLTAFIDGALGKDAHTQVVGHLNECPSCANREREERGAATLLRRRAHALKDVPTPPGLRTRCAAVATTQPAPVLARWPSMVPVALAVVLIAVTATALTKVGASRSNAVLAAQLALDHVKCFALFQSGTNRAADPVVVKAMLRDRYGWNVDVPASTSEADLRLDGARRCQYGDGPIPHVMYQAHGQNVSLFVLEGVTRTPSDVSVLGHRAKIWTRGRNTYVMVSSAAAGTLSDVVGYLQQETH